jgi:hypothetical protein
VSTAPQARLLRASPVHSNAQQLARRKRHRSVISVALAPEQVPVPDRAQDRVPVPVAGAEPEEELFFVVSLHSAYLHAC